MNKPLISVVTPIRAFREESIGWMQEAIKSVQSQDFQDWELLIVTDRSKVSLKPPAELVHGDDRIYAYRSEGDGVAAARNTGASKAMGQFLLPLDHDDILPAKAMSVLLEAWNGGGKDFGVIYGDVVSFGVDYQRNMQMPKFLFTTLLRTLIMPIGSLHERAAWEAIGGWDSNFQIGLEDWEYWIRMTVNGFHGYHVDAVTYHYRRHPHGRLAALRTDDDKFAAANAAIRTKFKDYYNGKEPKMCKGCGHRAGTFRPRGGAKTTPLPATVAFSADAGRIQVNYIGRRGGSFHIVGKATGQRYSIPGGKNSLVLDSRGKPGVHPSDARFFRAYDGGRAFRVEPAPQSAPVPVDA